MAGGIATVTGLLLKGEFETCVNELTNGWGTLDVAQQAMAASFGQLSGVMILYSVVCFVVVKDLCEGEYYKVLGRPNIVGAMPPVGEDATAEATAEAAPEGNENEREAARETEGIRNEISVNRMPSFVQGVFSTKARIILLLSIISDTLFVGYSAITFYAMIPVCLAAWSLFRRGTDFEYIVAPKPE